MAFDYTPRCHGPPVSLSLGRILPFLSLGIYKVLRGMLPSPGGDIHSRLGLFLFILIGTRQKPRYYWQRRRLLRNWAQILYEYFKWQNPVDSFGEGRIPDLLVVALFIHVSAVRTGGVLCYWPELSLASAAGRESGWHVERTWRTETSPTWLPGG